MPVAQPDRASDFGSEGWGFESLQARIIVRPLRRVEAAIVSAKTQRLRRSGKAAGFGRLETGHHERAGLVQLQYCKTKSSDDLFMGQQRKVIMKTTKALLAIAICGGLTLTAMAGEHGKHQGEKVDLKSLPESVQKTINEKAEGGQVVNVMREDDPDGKWNYEVHAKANGKDLKFEVDPNGSFVKNQE